jgi:hypothetical protein
VCVCVCVCVCTGNRQVSQTCNGEIELVIFQKDLFIVPLVRFRVELDSPYQVCSTVRATSVSEKLPPQHGAWQKTSAALVLNTLKDEVILNRVQNFS